MVKAQTWTPLENNTMITFCAPDPPPSTSNVDINNLVELVLVSNEETNIDHEVVLLEIVNLHEELPKQKIIMVAISLVNDLKVLNDFA
jgi:hypothetical protein